MACHIFGAKPLPKPTLTYCQSDPYEQTTAKLESKYKTFDSWHDDIIKFKHFPRYWPFVWGIHRSQVNSPHKGQWRIALIFSFICAWINGWVNNHEAGDLKCHLAHYDVIVMKCISKYHLWNRSHFVQGGIIENGLFMLHCQSEEPRGNDFRHCKAHTSTVYWCVASKLKA